MRRVSLLLLLCNAAVSVPTLYFWDLEKLSQSRARLATGDLVLKPAYDALLSRAGEALKKGPWSVTNKELPLADGCTANDYQSIAIYEWPCDAYPKGCKPYPGGHMPPPQDCHNDTGLPWLPCDGLVDHVAVDKGTAGSAGDLRSNVITLSLAYFFTGDDDYVRVAAANLRTWFMDDKLRMLPRILCGQSSPGHNSGSHGGMIEWTGFVELLDAISLLSARPSVHWTSADASALKVWTEELLGFIRGWPSGSNPFMKGEDDMKNNHGTWYDSTTSAIALFASNSTVARSILSGVPARRIDTQILPSGQMPLETARSNGASYTIYNLNAFVRVATFAPVVHADVWSYRSSAGSSVRAALDFVLPFASGEKPWPYNEEEKANWSGLYLPLHLAARAYSNQSYVDVACKLVGASAMTRNTTVENLVLAVDAPCP